MLFLSKLLIANSIILGLLAIIWSRERWKNTIVKVLLAALTAFNLFELLLTLGYLVKVAR